MDSKENKIALKIQSCEEISNIPKEQISQAQKFTFSLRKFQQEKLDFSHCLNRVEDFSNLKKLFIDCNWNSKLKELINLKQFVQQLNNLMKLKLRFSHSQFLTKESILEIVLCLQNKFHLKSLALNFYGFKQLNDEHITQICQGISKIKVLNSLDLQFGSHYSIFELSLSQIWRCLLSHLNLQKLNLSFQRLRNIDRIKEFPQTLAKLTNLRFLSLTLDRYLIFEEQQLVQINKSVSNILLLEYLYLDFHENSQMNQEAVNELLKSLKNLLNLKYFYLDLNGIESIKNLQSLGQSLYQLTSLNQINLIFASFCKLEIGPFGSLITHNQCIQILDIDLAYCSNLSKESLQLFNRDLCFLQNLNQLTIRLNYIYYIPKLFKDDLCQVIKGFTKLIKIQVKIYYCKDETKLKFIQAFSQLKSLNYVSFHTENNQNKFMNKIYKIKRIVHFSDYF